RAESPVHVQLGEPQEYTFERRAVRIADECDAVDREPLARRRDEPAIDAPARPRADEFQVAHVELDVAADQRAARTILEREVGRRVRAHRRPVARLDARADRVPDPRGSIRSRRLAIAAALGPRAGELLEAHLRPIDVGELEELNPYVAAVLVAVETHEGGLEGTAVAQRAEEAPDRERAVLRDGDVVQDVGRKIVGLLDERGD